MSLIQTILHPELLTAARMSCMFHGEKWKSMSYDEKISAINDQERVLATLVGEGTLSTDQNPDTVRLVVVQQALSNIVARLNDYVDSEAEDEMSGMERRK